MNAAPDEVVQTIVEHVVEKDYGNGKAHASTVNFGNQLMLDPCQCHLDGKRRQ